MTCEVFPGEEGVGEGIRSSCLSLSIKILLRRYSNTLPPYPVYPDSPSLKRNHLQGPGRLSPSLGGATLIDVDVVTLPTGVTNPLLTPPAPGPFTLRLLTSQKTAKPIKTAHTAPATTL